MHDENHPRPTYYRNEHEHHLPRPLGHPMHDPDVTILDVPIDSVEAAVEPVHFSVLIPPAAGKGRTGSA